MFITLNSQNRSVGTNDVDTASNFINIFNENIIIPKNSVVGVHSVSVNITGEIVIDATNDTFEILLGSHSIQGSIPNGTYSIVKKAGGEAGATTYPFVEALNTALTTAITAQGLSSQFPPATNKFTAKVDGNNIIVELGMVETIVANNQIIKVGSSVTSSGIGAVIGNNKVTGNIFAGEANHILSNGVIDMNAQEGDTSTATRAFRYGEVIFKTGASGSDLFCGVYNRNTPSATPTDFAGFHIKSDDTIHIRETDSAGTNKFPEFDTQYTVDGGGQMWIKIIFPIGGVYPSRRARYYVNNDSTHDDSAWRLINVDVDAIARKRPNSSVRYKVGVHFVNGKSTRPNTASLDSSSGQWNITTAGSGVTVGVSTMASKVSTHGIITGGSVNISTVNSGGATGFNMTGATLPSRSTTGDFVEGDTITLTNGVVLTKTATALTVDVIRPSLTEIQASLVENPARNPSVANLLVRMNFPNGLGDILHFPNTVNGNLSLNNVLQATGARGLSASSATPEIFVNCPTLNVNSRNSAISSNTLTRFPIGAIDGQADIVGQHFHESFNIMYNQITTNEDTNINQLQIQLQDKNGANIASLIHPSSVSLHIKTMGN